MNAHTYLATTRRIGQQLLGDHRSLGLILGVPTMLLLLLWAIYRDVPVPPGEPRMFDRIAVTMLGVLPMLMMFLVTSVSMLRERSSGTLERLLTTPLRRGDLIAGYASAFALAALAQSALLCAVTFGLLGVEVPGAVPAVMVISLASAVVGVALGLLASAFAHTEFQAVQFMPVVIGPQIFLCGLLVPHERMARWLQLLADALPMTYAVRALDQVRTQTETTDTYVGALAVLAGFGAVAIALASVSLPRQTA